MKFETQRLIIRKPELKDVDDIFKNYTQDPNVTRFLVWKPHTKMETTKDWLQICIDSWDENKHLDFIIWHKEIEKSIGMISFRINSFIVNFGYVLAKSFWNKGIMTEACNPIISKLLERRDIYRIEAIHDLDNPASGKVMDKLGMEYEGILRKYSLHPNISNIPRDCKMYAIVK